MHVLGGGVLAYAVNRKRWFDTIFTVAFVSIAWEWYEFITDYELYYWSYQNLLQDVLLGIYGASLYACFKFYANQTIRS